MSKNKVLTIIVLGFLIPQITFASWWNPLTWFKKQESKIQTSEVLVVATTSNNKIVATSTKDKRLVIPIAATKIKEFTPVSKSLNPAKQDLPTPQVTTKNTQNNITFDVVETKANSQNTKTEEQKCSDGSLPPMGLSCYKTCSTGGAYLWHQTCPEPKQVVITPQPEVVVSPPAICYPDNKPVITKISILPANPLDGTSPLDGEIIPAKIGDTLIIEGTGFVDTSEICKDKTQNFKNTLQLRINGGQVNYNVRNLSADGTRVEGGIFSVEPGTFSSFQIQEAHANGYSNIYSEQKIIMSYRTSSQ